MSRLMHEQVHAGKSIGPFGQMNAGTERQRLAGILAQFVTNAPELRGASWLAEIRRSNGPIYGTRDGSGRDILEMDADGGIRAVPDESVER